MTKCDICNKAILYGELEAVSPSGEKVHHACLLELQDKLEGMAESKPKPLTDQESLFRKIRGLLRQAEGTDNEHEANAFLQKAQELMLRYQVDEEHIWRNDPTKRTKIEQIKVKIPDKSPGAQYKRIILANIAQVSSCRMYYTEGAGTSTVVGFPVDLAWVEMLFVSIMTQAQFKMALAQAHSTSHVRTFRTNFWGGFSERIDQRLRDTYVKAQTATDVGSSAGSTALAIRDRRIKVDDWVKQNLRLGAGRSSSSGRYDGGARDSGKFAADTTDISGGRRSVTKTKGQLGA